MHYGPGRKHEARAPSMHTHSSGSPRGLFTTTTRLEQSAVERDKWAMTGPATATTRTSSPTTIKMKCFTFILHDDARIPTSKPAPSPHLEDADHSPVDSDPLPDGAIGVSGPPGHPHFLSAFDTSRIKLAVSRDRLTMPAKRPSLSTTGSVSTFKDSMRCKA